MKHRVNVWCSSVTWAAVAHLAVAQAAPSQTAPSSTTAAPRGDNWVDGGAPYSDSPSTRTVAPTAGSSDTGDTWAVDDHSTSNGPTNETAFGTTEPQNANAPQPRYVVPVPAPRVVIKLNYQPTSDQESERPQWPSTLPYVEGMPPPPGYTLQESGLRGLVIGGIIPLSVFYGASFAVAQNNDFRGSAGWLAVPVVGPYAWLIAHHNEQHCSGDVCSNNLDSPESGLVIFDGLVQTAGAAMFITGLAVTRKQWVLSNQVSLHVVPSAAPSARGLSVLGQF
jgi:hypothetical protein